MNQLVAEVVVILYKGLSCTNNIIISDIMLEMFKTFFVTISRSLLINVKMVYISEQCYKYYLSGLCIYLPLYTIYMEFIEMIRWIALGFVPTLGMLEYTTRKLDKRTLVRLFVER